MGGSANVFVCFNSRHNAQWCFLTDNALLRCCNDVRFDSTNFEAWREAGRGLLYEHLLTRTIDCADSYLHMVARYGDILLGLDMSRHLRFINMETGDLVVRSESIIPDFNGIPVIPALPLTRMIVCNNWLVLHFDDYLRVFDLTNNCSRKHHFRGTYLQVTQSSDNPCIIHCLSHRGTLETLVLADDGTL